MPLQRNETKTNTQKVTGRNSRPSTTKTNQVQRNVQANANNPASKRDLNQDYNSLRKTIQNNQGILTSINDYLKGKYDKNTNAAYLKQIERISAGLGGHTGVKDYDSARDQYDKYLGQLKTALQSRQTNYDEIGAENYNKLWDASQVKDIGQYEQYVSDLQKQADEAQKSRSKAWWQNVGNILANAGNALSGNTFMPADTNIAAGAKAEAQKAKEEYQYAQDVLNIAKEAELNRKYAALPNYKAVEREQAKYAPDSYEYQWLGDLAKSKKTPGDYKDEIKGIDAQIAELQRTNHYAYEDYNSQTGETYQSGGVNDRKIIELKLQKNALMGEMSAAQGKIEDEKTKKLSDFKSLSEVPEDYYASIFNADSNYNYINDVKYKNGKSYRDSFGSNILTIGAQGASKIENWTLYDQMTDEEKQLYNYYYNNGDGTHKPGKESGDAYLDRIRWDLSQREANKEAEAFQEFTRKHYGLANTLEIPMSLASGAGYVDVAGQYLQNALTGDYNRINYNTPGARLAKNASTIKSTTTQDIIDATGVIDLDEAEHPILAPILNGKSLGDVYQLGMSTAESMTAGVLTGVTGIPNLNSVLLGGSAATQAMFDALERGATDEQALAIGGLDGIMEGFWEKYSWQQLIKNGPHPGLQALTEGTEEFNTSLADEFIERMILGENSSFRKAVEKYKEQGEEKPELKAWEDLGVQLLWDFVGGTAMGAFSDVAYNSIGNASRALTDNRAYKGNASEIVNIGDAWRAMQESAGLNDSAETADNVLEYLSGKKTADTADTLFNAVDALRSKIEAGEKVTNKDVRIAQEQIDKASRQVVENAIKESLSGTGNEQRASQIADAIFEGKGISARKGTAWIGQNEGLNKAYRAGMNSYADMLELADQAAKLTQQNEEAAKNGNKENAFNAEQRANALRSGADVLRSTKSLDRNAPIASNGDRLSNVTGIKVDGDIVSATLSTGETVNLDDLNMVERPGTSDEASFGYQIKRLVKSYGEASQAVYQGFLNSDMTLSAYLDAAEAITAIAKASTFGFDEGIKNLRNSKLVQGLSRLQQEHLWSIGKGLVVKQKTPTKNVAYRDVDVSTEDIEIGGETFKGASDMEAGYKDLATRIAKASKGNLSFHFFHGGKGNSVNGFYQSGVVYINVDAVRDGKSLVSYTMSHELTHFIQEYNADAYKKLKDFVVKKLTKKKGKTLNALVLEKQARDKGISYEDALDEVVADGCEMMLQNSNILEELAVQDQSLAQTVISHAKAFLKRVTSGLNPIHDEAKELMKYADQLQKMWDKALAEALTSEQEQKYVRSDDVEIKYKKADFEYMKPFAEQLKDFMDREHRSEIFGNDALMIGSTPKVLMDIGLTKLPVVIDQKHVGYAIDDQYKGPEKYKAGHTFDITEFAKLPEKLADPIAIIADTSRENLVAYIEMQNKAGVQTIVPIRINTGASIGGNNIDVQVAKTAFGDNDAENQIINAIIKDSKDSIRLYYANKKKIPSEIGEAVRKHGLTVPNGIIHSINEPGSVVKQKINSQTETRQFKQWFNGSKVVNKDGSPLIVYHGSPATDITVFDLGMAGKNTGVYSDKAIWFTDDYSFADGMAYEQLPGSSMFTVKRGKKGKVYGTYLSIKKPFNFRSMTSRMRNDLYEMYQKRLKDQGFSPKSRAEFDEEIDIALEAGNDQFAKFYLDYDMLRQKGYDGIIARLYSYPQNKGDALEYGVLKSTQIKSATDNVGIFDANNPDIRYSKQDTDQEYASYDEFKKSIESFPEEDISRYAKEAEKVFGITTKRKLAGYLDTNGKMLDFSEGQRYRTQDHRDIRDALNLPEIAEYSDPLIAFMNMGNIRLQEYGMDISKMPNSAQMPALRRFIDSVLREEGEFDLDISDLRGNNITSIEYPEGISSARIINDITAYFKDGVVPQEVDSLNKFRYSRADITDDELTEALADEDYERAERVANNDAALSRKALKHDLLNRFSIPEGLRDKLGKKIDSFADDILRDGVVNENTKEDLYNDLYDAGIIKMPAEETAILAAEQIRGSRLYVPDAVKNEFSGDYNRIRSKLMGYKVYLTSDAKDIGVDTVNAEMAEQFPHLFDATSSDEKEILENILDIFENQAKDKEYTLDDYAELMRKTEGLDIESQQESLERGFDYAVQAFSEKAELEFTLRNRLAGKLTREGEAKLQQRIKDLKSQRKDLKQAEEGLEKKVRAIQRERDRAQEQVLFYRNQLSVNKNFKKAKPEDVNRFTRNLLESDLWWPVRTQARDIYADMNAIASNLMNGKTDIYDAAYNIAAKCINSAIDVYGKDGRQDDYISALTSEIISGLFDADVRQEYTYAERMQNRLERAKADNKELKAKYQALKKQQAERRKASKYKQQILKLYDTANKMLTSPKKSITGHAAMDLMRAVAEMCQYIGTAQDKFYTNKYEALDKLIDEQGSTETRVNRERHLKKTIQQLSELQFRYNQVKNDPMYNYEYDESVNEMLNTLKDTLSGNTLDDLESDKLREIYDAMSALMKTVTEANKLTALNTEKTVLEFAKEAGADIDKAQAIKNGILRDYMNKQKSPDVMFNYFGGYKKGSSFNKMQQMFVDSMRRYLEVKKQFQEIFDESITNNKEFKQMMYEPTKHLVDWGLKDQDGNAVATSRGMMLAAYKLLLQEDSFNAIAKAGFQIPKIEAFYKDDMARAFGGGDDAKFYSQNRAQDLYAIVDRLQELDTQEEDLKADKANISSEEYNKQLNSIESQKRQQLRRWGNIFEEECAKLEELKSNIEDQLTDFEKEFLAKADQWYTHSDDLRNEVNLALYGFVKPGVKNYTPIHRDLAEVQMDIRTDNTDAPANLENAGFNKERVKARAPIQLTDINFDLLHSSEGIARFYGFTEAQRTFNKIYNAKVLGSGKDRNGQDITVKSKIGNKFGTGNRKWLVTGNQYIENYIRSIAGSNFSRENKFGKVYGHVARANLTLNLRVAVSQLASIPTAAAVLGWDNVLRGMGQGIGYAFSTKQKDQLAEKSIYFWQRYKGDGGMPEYSDASRGAGVVDKLYNRLQNTKVGHALLDWCKIMDCAATSMMYPMAEAYVDQHFGDLEGEAREAKIIEIYEETLRKTQPNYTETERSDLLRDKTMAMKIFTMFKTQSNQNLNLLINANGELRRVIRDKANGNATQAEVQEAKRNFANSFTAVVLGGSLAFAVLRMMSNFILGTLSGYRDDDDELTEESVLKGLGKEVLSSLAGNFMGGSQVFDFVWARVNHESYYGISDNAMGAISDLFDSAFKLQVKPDEGSEEPWANVISSWSKFALEVCDFAGIPISNAKKITEAGEMWANDLKNGTFGKFEGNVERTDAQNYNIIIKRFLNEDYAGSQEMYDSMFTSWGEKQDVEAGMKRSIKDKFIDGHITEDDAMSLLLSYVMDDENDAADLITEWHGVIDTGYTYNDIQEAYMEGSATANDLRNYMATYKFMEKDAIDKKINELDFETENGFAPSKLKDAYVEGEITAQEAARYYHEVYGKDIDDAKVRVSEWQAYKDTGIEYSEIEDAYYDGKITYNQVVNMLKKYGDKSNSEYSNDEQAVRYADKWRFNKENPKYAGELDVNQVSRWYSEYKGKVKIDKFMMYLDFIGNGYHGAAPSQTEILEWMPSHLTYEEALALWTYKGWSTSEKNMRKLTNAYGK